jgi:hypothetical protein
MFDPYIIVDDSLRNVRDGDDVIGFAFEARCGYYRRLILSMVEDLAVTVDGVPQPRGAVRLTVAGRTYSLDELSSEFTAAWEFGDPATVTVLSAGGLTVGSHEIGLAERLRISYLPGPHTPSTVQVQEVAA